MVLNLKIFAVFQTEHKRMSLCKTVKHSKNFSLIFIKCIMIEVLYVAAERGGAIISAFHYFVAREPLPFFNFFLLFGDSTYSTLI